VAESKATLLISCIDRPGIIARVAGHLFTLGCNIITSDQYSDDEDGHFFWRIHFESLRQPISELSKDLAASMPSLLPWERLRWHLFDTAKRDRVVIMVSRLPHCMMDLLSRHRFGELDGDVVGVISNHPDVEPLARPFEVPFTVIPVPKLHVAPVIKFVPTMTTAAIVSPWAPVFGVALVTVGAGAAA